MPTAPTAAQLNARNAAVGAPATSSGAYSTGGDSANNPNEALHSILPPTTQAQFTSLPQGTQKAPAVVTSHAAEDHVNNMAGAANQATQDAQNLAAHNAAVSAASSMAPTGAGGTGGGSSSSDANSSSPDSQINDILSSLGDAYGQSAEPTADQQSEVDTAGVALGIDNQAISQVGSQIDSMNAGTFPLSPTEQNQVNALKGSYANAIKTAQQYVQSVNAGATVAGAQSGLQMYSPDLNIANINSAVTKAGDKVDQINSQLSSAVSKLTTSLQNADYRSATALYDKISKDITARQKVIDDVNKAVQDETKQMHTDALEFAKLQISAVTNAATRDATASYRAQNLILQQTRLTDQERKTAFDELHHADGQRTASERAASATASFAEKFVPGATMPNGDAVVDNNGYITPVAWKAAIQDAPKEGLTRADFIKSFGSQIYSDSNTGIDGRAYGLTPAEIKLINGALPTP